MLPYITIHPQTDTRNGIDSLRLTPNAPLAVVAEAAGAGASGERSQVPQGAVMGHCRVSFFKAINGYHHLSIHFLNRQKCCIFGYLQWGSPPLSSNFYRWFLIWSPTSWPFWASQAAPPAPPAAMGGWFKEAHMNRGRLLLMIGIKSY
jgi:hypothetical protein